MVEETKANKKIVVDDEEFSDDDGDLAEANAAITQITQDPDSRGGKDMPPDQKLKLLIKTK